MLYFDENSALPSTRSCGLRRYFGRNCMQKLKTPYYHVRVLDQTPPLYSTIVPRPLNPGRVADQGSRKKSSAEIEGTLGAYGICVTKAHGVGQRGQALAQITVSRSPVPEKSPSHFFRDWRLF
ncbi:unnamed protein product [Sphacelaria rigidula]